MRDFAVVGASILLALLCTLSYGHRNETIIHINSTSTNCSDNATFEIVTCHDLDQALDWMNNHNSAVLCLHSNTRYQLRREHNIVNGLHLAIKGNNSTIACNQGAGISFNESSEIKLRGLMLDGCGALHSSTSRDFLHPTDRTFLHYKVALYFMFCENVTLDFITIQHSTGTGLVFFDSTGHNEILNSTFSHLQPGNDPSTFGGGVIIEFTGCMPGSETCAHHRLSCFPLCHYMSGGTFTFKCCLFTNNNASSNISVTHIPKNKKGTFSFGKGGALAVYFRDNASDNTISLQTCEFRSNAAKGGGGIYTVFENTTNNTIEITSNSTFKDNRCRTESSQATDFATGGAVHVGFLSRSHNNSLLIRDSHFENNSAYYGGAIEIFSESNSIEQDETDKVSIERTVFEKNTARLGAAIELYRKPEFVNGYMLEPNLVDCIFNENGGVYHYTHGSIGQTHGTLYINHIQVHFRGNTSFHSSKGTALSLHSSVISLEDNSRMEFVNCSSDNGGAIYLSGSATIIYLHSNTEMNFHHNWASGQGGAIYADQSKEYYTAYSYNCFIRYYWTTARPSKWNTTVVFSNNKAGKVRNSIFAQSLLPCVWATNVTSTLMDDLQQVFCSWNNWTFDNNCTDEIETAAARVDLTSKAITVHPGWGEELPMRVFDDLDRDVTEQTMFFAYSQTQNSRKGKQESVHNKQLILHNKPSSNTTILLLKTMNTRAIYAEVKVTIQRCPPGFVLFNVSENYVCVCGRGFGGAVQCNATNRTSYLLLGYCMTYSIAGHHPQQRQLVGRCPSTLENPEGLLYIPLNISTEEELNETFCHQYNRRGFLCEKCIEGYGISVFSNTFKCINCTHSSMHRAWNWLTYFTSTLGPITLLFAIVVLLHISISSGPANGFIFFSQVLTIPLKVLLIQGGWTLILHRQHTARVLTNLLMQPYKIWSLDFTDIFDFHTCVGTSLKTLDILVLRYVSAVYPLFLVAVCFVLVELHARNNRLIVCLSKPLCVFCARVRRKWQGTTSIIDAFATFITLSYIKFIRISITILTPSGVYSDTGHRVTYVVNYDNQVQYLSKEHAPYFVLALFVMCTFGLLTPLLLIVYPTVTFQHCLNRCRLRTEGLRTFVEAFHGCYKDGTAGEPDRRFFAGLYFMFRIVIFTIFMVSTSYFAMFLMLQVAYIIFLFLIVLLQPYKTLWYNYLDAFFFALCGILVALVTYLYINLPLSGYLPHGVFYLTYSLCFVPLLYMIGYMVYWVSYKSHWLRQKLAAVRCWKKRELALKEMTDHEQQPARTEVDPTGDLPDRLAHPQDYEDSSSDEEIHVIPQFASERTPLMEGQSQRYGGTMVINAATY